MSNILKDKDAQSLSDATTTQFNAFSKYISRTLLARLDKLSDDIAAEKVYYHAAVLFSDVSGFTKLTESLTIQYGSEHAVGAEHLTFMLSEYFDRLIEIVHGHDGDVIKFAGDALLILFPLENELLALQRASSCGVKMQQLANDIAIEIERDDGVELSLKVAISYGEIGGMMLGGIFNRWEYAVISDAIVELGYLGDLCQPHDVLISQKSFTLLQKSAGAGLQSESRAEAVVNLQAVPNWDLQNKALDLKYDTGLSEKVRCFIPAAIVKRIVAGQTDSRLLGELRRVSVLFINLPKFTPDINIKDAQQLVSIIQETCYSQRGSIDKLSSDDKGVSVIAGFGIPPMSAEDDPIRAVKAAMAIIKIFDELGLVASIGVASGPVYCGTLGIRYRQEYTIMGDGVNTAARLMQKANHNILCDEITKNECINEINFNEGIAFTLKGKSKQVLAFQPIDVKEKEQLSEVAIVGRQNEQQQLNTVLDSLGVKNSVLNVFIEGEAGIGKSALVQAFV